MGKHLIPRPFAKTSPARPGLTGWMLIAATCLCTPALAEAERPLEFVVVSFYSSIYETKYMEECPRGAAIGNDEIWWKSPDPAVRDELTDGGEIEPVTASRRAMSAKPGLNGKDVSAMPASIEGPPLKIVEVKFSFGTESDIRGGWNAILKETLIQKLSS